MEICIVCIVILLAFIAIFLHANTSIVEKELQKSNELLFEINETLNVIKDLLAEEKEDE